MASNKSDPLVSQVVSKHAVATNSSDQLDFFWAAHSYRWLIDHGGGSFCPYNGSAGEIANVTDALRGLRGAVKTGLVNSWIQSKLDLHAAPAPAPAPDPQLASKLDALRHAYEAGALSPALFEQAQRELQK